MLISFIIPVYNTKVDALKRCFDSMTNLIGFDCDVLIIDDGSTIKETWEYCQSYAEKHLFFNYHRKDNSGVSSARNFGVKIAQGEYVCFVDSDDEFVYSNLDIQVLEKRPDIVFYDIQFIENHKKYIVSILSCCENNNIDYIKLLKVALTNNSVSHPVGKLYKKIFLLKNDLFFNEKMIHGEDRVFNINALEKKPIVKYINKTIYQYYLDPITYSNREKKFPEKFLNDCLLAHFQRKKIYQTYFLDTPIENLPRMHHLLLDELFSGFINISTLENREEIMSDCEKLIDNAARELIGLKFTGITKFKYIVFKNQCWIAIRILAYVKDVRYKLNKLRRA